MGLLHSGEVSGAGFWIAAERWAFEHFCPTMVLVNVLEKDQR